MAAVANIMSAVGEDASVSLFVAGTGPFAASASSNGSATARVSGTLTDPALFEGTGGVFIQGSGEDYQKADSWFPDCVTLACIDLAHTLAPVILTYTFAGDFAVTYTYGPAAVPLPATLILLLGGLGVALYRTTSQGAPGSA